MNKEDKAANDTNQLNTTLTSLISKSLIEIIIDNRNRNEEVKEDEFYSIRIPNMTLNEYIARIVKHSKLESSTLVMSYLLICNMINEQHYSISLRNVYRMILASVVICIKFNEDSQFNNKYYAKIGGLTNEELNAIEYNFFIKIGCQLSINEEKYNQTLNALMTDT